MSCVKRKPTLWFPKRANIKRAVQAQKMAKGWLFLNLESRGIVIFRQASDQVEGNAEDVKWLQVFDLKKTSHLIHYVQA